jgi:hypothetical protein
MPTLAVTGCAALYARFHRIDGLEGGDGRILLRQGGGGKSHDEHHSRQFRLQERGLLFGLRALIFISSCMRGARHFASPAKVAP